MKGTDYKMEQFHSYNFADVWGGTNEETVEFIHQWYETPDFDAIEPITGAKEVLEKYKKKYKESTGTELRYVVCTSRQTAIVDKTFAWLDKHYAGLFDDVLFGNHYSRANPDPTKMDGTKRTKADMCKELGAVLLIDDAVGYNEDVISKGAVAKGTVLFGDYGWNKGGVKEEYAGQARKCTSWEEVDKVLGEVLGVA
jgi:hypothetical protein